MGRTKTVTRELLREYACLVIENEQFCRELTSAKQALLVVGEELTAVVGVDDPIAAAAAIRSSLRRIKRWREAALAGKNENGGNDT